MRSDSESTHSLAFKGWRRKPGGFPGSFLSKRFCTGLWHESLIYLLWGRGPPSLLLAALRLVSVARLLQRHAFASLLHCFQTALLPPLSHATQALPCLPPSPVSFLTNSCPSPIVIFRNKKQKLNPGHCDWQQFQSPFKLCDFGNSPLSGFTHTTVVGSWRTEPDPPAFHLLPPLQTHQQPSSVWRLDFMLNDCCWIKSAK